MRAWLIKSLWGYTSKEMIKETDLFHKFLIELNNDVTELIEQNLEKENKLRAELEHYRKESRRYMSRIQRARTMIKEQHGLFYTGILDDIDDILNGRDKRSGRNKR